MKILLTSLNSKFIHTNLAIRYLKSMVHEYVECKILEFTINQRIEKITYKLLKEDYDILGFSTYIWNIEESLKVASNIKKAKPNIKIIFGGPEVSYDVKNFLKDNPFVDFVISGEGEEVFKEFILLVKNKLSYSNLKGLSYRHNEDFVINDELRIVENLNIIPSPYQTIIKKDDLKKEFENKIIYYESSRGCPFNCGFCLSSTIKKTRYFALDRVKQDIKLFLNLKVKQVKFIDRTFNANKVHFYDILQFIKDNDNGITNFHFEVVASLMDDECIEFLNDSRKNLFQLEIGVQSTNPESMKAVGRNLEFEKIKYVVKKLDEKGNIHQHLDLIAGLPFEDYNSFAKSFDNVYSIGAEKLQLGFLKLLKGSPLRNNYKVYGYKFTDYPPYEIISNYYMSYLDIIKLKEIEEVVEIYGNENYFSNTLRFILKEDKSPFKFFEQLAEYWVKNKYADILVSRAECYNILFEFLVESGFDIKIIKNLLQLDFILNNTSSKVPSNLKFNMVSNNILHETIKEIKLNKLYDFDVNIKTSEDAKYSVIIKFEPYLESEYISGEYILFYKKNNNVSSYNVDDLVRRLLNE